MGNLRVAFRDFGGTAEIVQANSYGIWGEDLPTLNYSKPFWKVDNFKFTGKESLQGTGFIDFGARWLDNIVPRFTTIDPLAELSRRFSPFTYGNNNPVLMIDPDGMKSINSLQKAWDDTAEGSSSSWTNDGNGGFSDGGDDIVKIKGQDYYKNTGNIFASIGNKINSLFGGDPNYFVEHKAYDRVEEKMLQEFNANAIGFVAGGVILKGAGRIAGGMFGKSIWKMNPFERGREIESMLGGNLPGNFPVIDKFVNGAATSIKSVDLTSASYQSASGLRSLLNGYVNSIAEFTGRSWAGAQVGTNATNQIVSRTLEIAIPKGTVNATQQAVMNQIIQNGLNATNPVTVTFIPL